MNSSGDDLVGDLEPHDDNFLLDFQAQPDFLRIEKSPHYIRLLQYYTAIKN